MKHQKQKKTLVRMRIIKSVIIGIKMRMNDRKTQMNILRNTQKKAYYRHNCFDEQGKFTILFYGGLGSPELRKIYRDIMLDKGYNAVEDRWGQNEVRSGKLASPSAIMILDKRIFKSVKVK